jgi:hypothetical protein
LFSATANAADERVRLTYSPPASVQQGEPVLSLGTVTDGRENDPDWFGAVRGGYGNPLKVLRTEGTVAAEFERNLREALVARRLVAEANPRFRLDIRLTRFDSGQFMVREAHVIFVLTLVDLSTNAAVYEHPTSVGVVDGGPSWGIFSSSERLRVTANRAMQQALDQALDDPGLRTALQSAPNSGPAAPATQAGPGTTPEPPPAGQ